MAEIIDGNAARFAVIGTGVMGGNHIRTIGTLPNAELVTVVDTNPERTQGVINRFGLDGVRAATSLDGINSRTVDIAVVATPSHLHMSQAMELMENGVHVLIEKPVASTPEEVRELEEFARKMGVVATAGHVELFNPVFSALQKILFENPGLAIEEMEFERLSQQPDASRLYHNVVTDLMIHDFTLALKLIRAAGGNPDDYDIVNASGRNGTSASPDPARATVRFGDIDTHFRASRAYPAGKKRKITVEGDLGLVRADLLTRRVSVTTAQPASVAPDGVLQEDTLTRVYYPQSSGEPLAREIEHMMACVQGRATPESGGVSMEDAYRAIKLARGVLDKIRQTA